MPKNKFTLPMTMLIITPPALYMAYAGYVYYTTRFFSELDKKDKQKQGIIKIWESFQNCRQTSDLLSIYRTALQYVHTSIV